METGRNRTETVRFPKRIGMIVPSSNTVVEPICCRIFFGMEDVAVSYTHLDVYKRQLLWQQLMLLHPASLLA